jgi:hypothetical protein
MNLNQCFRHFLWSSLLSFIFCLTANGQAVVLFEDFNSASLPTGWTTNAISGSTSWSFGMDGSSQWTGNRNLDGTSFAYFDDFALVNSTNNTVELISPVFDNSNTLYSTLRFDYNYVDYNMAADSFRVDIFDGLNWVTIFSRTYDDCGSYLTCTPASGFPSAWIWLTPYANANCQIRFVYFDGNSRARTVGIDNVRIIADYDNDLEVSKVISPRSNCNLSANEVLEVQLKNTAFGDTIKEIIIVCDVDNGAQLITDTVNANILGRDTFNYTFNSRIDLSAIGNHELKVYATYALDPYPYNDTLIQTITHDTVFSIPYFDDYEGVNRWTAEGAKNSWELGLPAGTVIDSAYSGTNAFVTNLTGNYNDNERSYLVSPCFDLSQIVRAPEVSFYLRHEIQPVWDSLILEYSIDGDSTWVKVEEEFLPVNWHSNGSAWKGSSGTNWIKVENTLLSLLGEQTVKFRFTFESNGSTNFEGVGIDNFSLMEGDSLEVELKQIVHPLNASLNTCGLDEESIVIEIENNGGTLIDSLYLFYQVNGGAVVRDTLVGGLLPYKTRNFAFKNKYNFINNGSYNLNAWISVRGDTISSNDTITNYNIQKTQNYAGYSIPFNEPFSNPGFKERVPNVNPSDSIGNGWSRSNILYNWKMIGPYALSGLTGNTRIDYNGKGSLYAGLVGGGPFGVGDTAFLESPCIDLTNKDSIALDFWYHKRRTGLDSMSPLFVEAFNGSQWIVLDEVSDNPQTAFADPWKVRSIDLGPFARTKTKFRFSSVRELCCSQNISIDNISIYETTVTDVEISEIIVPQGNCNVVDSVTVVIHNKGRPSIADSIPFSFSVNGVVQRSTIPLASPLKQYESIPYVISSLNLNPSTSHVIRAWAAVAADADPINDTLSIAIDALYLTPNKKVEDFESFIDGNCFGFVGNTPVDVFSNSWKEKSKNRFYWNVQNGANCSGTSSGNTGPSFDHTSGIGNFMYTEASFITSFNDTAIFESPSCIDFSNSSTAGMRFWYHRFGTQMGDLFIDVFANGVWNIGIDTLTGQSQTSSLDAWKLRKVNLTQFAGQIIQVRFRAIYGGGDQGDMAIDDVEFYTPIQQDARLTGIDLGQASCEQDSAKLFLTVNNFGLDSIAPNSLKIYYEINGNTILADSNSSVVPSDSNVIFTISISNLYAQGSNGIVAWIQLANDSNAFNDTIGYNFSTLNKTPEYTEGFENIISLLGQCGNYNTPLNLDWEIDFNDSWVAGHDSLCNYGANGATPITSTGPDSAYAGHGFMYFEPAFNSVVDTANLNSTCIDLRNDSISYLDFYYHMYGAGIGKLYIDAFVNGMSTRLDSIVGQQHVSTSDSWSLKTINLNQFAGDIVRIRFIAIESTNTSISDQGAISIDNVRISNSFPVAIIEINESASQLQLFPNPTNGEFILRGKSFTNSELKVSLVDLNGRLIETRIINPASNSINERFDLSNQANGVYLISIQSEGKVEVKKVVLSGS